jgi:hypothetical protein
MSSHTIQYLRVNTEEWSSDWPFHNVQRVVDIELRNGRFTDDDVRRL